MSRIEECGITMGLGATSEEAEGNSRYIITGKRARVKRFGEFLETYPQMPWVYKDIYGKERGLIDEERRYIEIVNGEPQEKMYYCKRVYINPSAISSVEDRTVSDNEGVDYAFCVVTMNDGSQFYMSDFWANIAEEMAEVEEAEND